MLRDRERLSDFRTNLSHRDNKTIYIISIIILIVQALLCITSQFYILYLKFQDCCRGGGGGEEGGGVDHNDDNNLNHFIT